MAKDTPASELLNALASRDVPQKAIAQTLGLAPSAVSNLYAGGRHLKYDEGVKLKEVFGDLLPTRELPLIGMAGAGNWLEAVEVTRDHVSIPADIEGDFAVEIVGDSMNLLLPDGSVAIVNPRETQIFVGKLYLLRNDDGEATVKRFREDPARFEPVSDNPIHQPFELGALGFSIIGRVTGAVQRF